MDATSAWALCAGALGYVRTPRPPVLVPLGCLLCPQGSGLRREGALGWCFHPCPLCRMYRIRALRALEMSRPLVGRVLPVACGNPNWKSFCVVLATFPLQQRLRGLMRPKTVTVY